MKSIVFPGKVIFGKDSLASFAKYAQPLGKKFLVIGSKSVMGVAREKISASFAGTDMSAEFVMFGGECSRTEINRLAGIGNAQGCNAVVGFGGGKVLDTAKAVAATMNAPVMIIPTIAATDAPCSAVSVVYTDDHVFEECIYLPANPNIVMIDTDIIVKAPVRFLISGMGDALATYFEARAVKNSDSNTCAVAAIGKQTLAAFALAELCYKTLLADGEKAICAMETGVVTPAVENIIEANVLLSGIGFESGGLAGAHSIHNGLTVLPQTHQAYHGEKVAFGTLTQLVMENAPMDEIKEVVDFCHSVGLPTTFAEIGLDSVTDEELWRVAEASAAPGESIHCEPFEVTPKKVFIALMAADSIGESFKRS